MEATTVMVIPETLECVMLMIGNFSHLLRLSFDFFSGSHFISAANGSEFGTDSSQRAFNTLPATWRGDFPPGAR